MAFGSSRGRQHKYNGGIARLALYDDGASVVFNYIAAYGKPKPALAVARHASIKHAGNQFGGYAVPMIPYGELHIPIRC
jgi:hypothetical protein